MSKVWVSSDWHIGHKNIHKFRCKELGFFRDFENEGEHCEWLMDFCLSNVTKYDTMILTGDIVFTEEALRIVGSLPGRKVLVKGNHDVKKSEYYPKVFDQVHGLLRHKHCWFSHAPIHPVELRGKVNVHGHVHYNTLEDTVNYQSICVEELIKIFGTPCVLWEDLMEYRRSIHE